MVESEEWWAKDSQPPQEDKNSEAFFFFSAESGPEIFLRLSLSLVRRSKMSRQGPAASYHSVMASRWTLPGSPIGKRESIMEEGSKPEKEE